MVLIRPIEASRTIDIGDIPSTQIDDGIGRGLQQVGGAVSQHANQTRALKESVEDTDTDEKYRQFVNQQQQAYQESKVNMPVNGLGWSSQTMASYAKARDTFLTTVPERLRHQYGEKSNTLLTVFEKEAATDEVAQLRFWSLNGVTDLTDQSRIGVANNPNTYQGSLEAINRRIDMMPGYAPAEKAEFKKQAAISMQKAVALNDILQAEQTGDIGNLADKLGIRSAVDGGGVDAVVNKIIGVESGGRANAKNPNSSASGLGQFIDSTWISTVRKHRPDIANGRSNQELIALKSDPQLGREMTKAHTQENAEFLANQGIPQTAGNIYLAHFLGSRGAAQVLRADPNTPIESIVGPGVVQANGFLRGKSASEVAAWASRKMGSASGASSTVPADPRYSQLTLEERVSVYQKAEAGARQANIQRQAQQTAQRDAANDQVNAGIVAGTVRSEQDIWDNPYLDLGQKAARVTQFRTAQKGIIQAQSDIAAINGGSFAGDPYQSDFKTRVDNAAAFARKSLPADQAQSFVESMVRQSGSVDSGTVNSIRVGAASRSPADVQQAMELGSRLTQINRNALSTRDGGASIQNQIDLYDSLKRNGYDATEAARRVAEQNDPEMVVKRQAIVKSEPVQKVIKKVSSSDVQQVFASGWFSSPNVGGESTQQFLDIGASIEAEAQIVADYKSILEDAFAEANGNETVARDMAATRMKKIYGTSETSVFGSKTVMRLPPENTYAPLPDGSHGYIKEQLYEALKAEGVDFDEAWLESYDVTDADYQAKRPAHYQIVYSKGAEKSLFHLPFYADRDAALAKYQQAEQLLIDERMTAREQSMAAEQYKYPDGRNGPERFGNDELYRGIAREGSPLANAAAAAHKRQITPDQAQSINLGTAASVADYLAGGDIPMGAGSAWSNPEAQQVGGVSGVIKQQRKQLFDEATNNGTLPKKGK